MASMSQRWDIFCQVIDNLGDIGVCWRLARQLSREHALQVRLWVDDPSSLQGFCPQLRFTDGRAEYAGVEIIHWCPTTVRVASIADVVIEAFACTLPASYVEAMAKATRPPCWINLEYLTAESWIDDCHGLASPHPTLPLVKHFFFPGFTPASGGLLREGGLLAARNHERARGRPRERLEISLFCYSAAPVGEFLEVLAKSPQAARLRVAPGQPLASVSAGLGGSGPWQLGSVLVEPFAFLPQDEYDRLLWDCDINFVRGEDSFVRAQWAAQPFVWHIYAQEEDAHQAKLMAFLAKFTAGMEASTGTAAVNLFRAWNFPGTGDLGQAWHEFLSHREAIGAHAREWSASLSRMPDLAAALVKFCTSRL
jgi:uncharacterized repeat protein (TIGR03837 family)